MNALDSLAARWKAEADTLDRYAPQLASIVRLHAIELEEAIRSTGDELLTLEEAVSESGYSERTLRSMLTSGAVPQAGRRGAPRIRRGDLPKKPSGTAAGYDPSADAASILTKLGAA